LRIVSGLYRGKTINPPRNFRARPTTDFAKEGLFNILTNVFDFEDTEVLDLFSGTGSIGYEFASRGASSIEMVEKNYMHTEFIRKTADPPYEMEGIAAIPDKVLSSKLLKENGWFILEHGGTVKFKDHPACFDHRNYGNVNFSFFRRGEKSGDGSQKNEV